MRGALSAISAACGGGAERARLGAQLLGEEAEETCALGLVEALALMPPAVEFELALHGSVV